MIALSGAHTIGASHCNRFADRLFSSSGVDPSLNRAYAEQIKQACPRNVDPNVVVQLDPTTPNTFDNVYYQNLIDGKGLFKSDEILFTSSASKSTVVEFANNGGEFNAAFGVKTGRAGEIRRDCSAFN
ncbi:peroxidase 51-like [Cucurbita maxima]|uniref:peroxidase n=1 Tax=Cucurbita maxima TaxID=3661 RepID=A0A6J1JS48_CUCMA|nr:peroxidase 51-like [Cucurbita maxima]